MATKEEAVLYVTKLGEEGIITRDELNDAYTAGSKKPVLTHEDTAIKKLGLAGVFNYIGGGIILLGLVILIAQNWNELNFAAQVLVTLGSGVVAYAAGVFFTKSPKMKDLSTVFHLIGGVMMPIGLTVVLDHAGVDLSNFGTQAVLSLCFVLVYLVSDWIFKKNVLTLFSILFGTLLFVSLANYIIDASDTYLFAMFYQYLALFIGLAYVLLGYGFSKTRRMSLTNFLYGFGLIVFYTSALALSGFDREGNTVWNLILPVLLCATLYFSVQLKNRPMLVMGTVFLMVYILKVTAEYFSDSLGWPLALVIAGLGMIGIGYVAMNLRKKYFVKGQ